MKTTSEKQSQVKKFKEAARELKADDCEEAFDERLKKIAKAAPPKKQDKPKNKADR